MKKEAFYIIVLLIVGIVLLAILPLIYDFLTADPPEEPETVLEVVVENNKMKRIILDYGAKDLEIDDELIFAPAVIWLLPGQYVVNHQDYLEESFPLDETRFIDVSDFCSHPSKGYFATYYRPSSDGVWEENEYLFIYCDEPCNGIGD